MGSHDDHDDESGHDASLHALDERQREIDARLRAIVLALRDAGAVTDGFDTAFFLEPPPPDHAPGQVHERFFRRHEVAVDDALWKKLCEQRFDFDPPDRVRVEWRVNDLGREKCRELWEMFDLDGDGAWCFDEFCEYVAAIDEQLGKRVEMHMIGENEEVWRMYMSDSFEINANHCMTFDGFLRYRESIEAKYPLTYELQALGVSLEWRVVEHMQSVMRIVGEYFGDDEILPFRQAQFLVGECGQPAMYQELWQTLQRQRFFHKCHRYLLGQKRALRLFGYTQRTKMLLANPALEEDSRVCRSGLLALVLSRWEPQERTYWRTLFLRARLGSYSALRRLKRFVGTCFDWTRKAALTGLLRASCLQSSPERELGDYVFKVEVGPRFSTHSTVNMAYYGDADSAATLHELKYLERGAECFLYLDLACRVGTRESDAQWLCQRLTWFVELYFKDHLELLPFFFKWFFTIPSKTQLRAAGSGGSGGTTSAAGAPPVIRFVVLFTGGMDLYAIMQSLKLPPSMQFDHLLQRFSMHWMFSHTIEEIVTNKRLICGSQWCCRGQIDTRFNRQAWGQILRQCAMKMDDEVAMEKEEQEYMEQRAKHGAVELDPTANLANEESRDPAWIQWLHHLALVIDSSKKLSLTWSFQDLWSVFDKNVCVKSAYSSNLFQRTIEMLSSPGAIANEWKVLNDSFRAEFAKSRFVVNSVKSSVATASAVASATIGRKPISRVSSRSSLGSAENWSLSSHHDVGFGQYIAASFPFASPMGTPAVPETQSIHNKFPHASTLPEESEAYNKREDPMEHDLLELYEAVIKTLQSVHSIRAEAGTSGVSIAFEGFNIFSILPQLAQLSAARRAPLVRTKSTMSNSSTSGVVPATPSSSGPTPAAGSGR